MDFEHLFVSPHLDDVVLSCGGTIATMVRAGSRVGVVTVHAGIPSSTQTSELADSLHTQWFPDEAVSSAEVVRRRRAEDRAAVEELGATAIHLDVADCIYRRSDSSWRYPTGDAIFGSLHPDDEDAITAAATALASVAGVGEATTIWCPLAVGGHADHRVTRRALERWREGRTFRHFEDFPYAGHAGALDEVSRDPRWRASLVPLDAPALDTKVAAMAHYVSQVPFLFPGTPSAMREALYAYAQTVAAGAETHWAERRWDRT